MAYTLQWLVQDRVLLGRFTGRLTADELEQFVAEEHALIRQGTPLIHYINDARFIDGMDFNLRTLQILTRSLKSPEGVGWHLDIINGRLNRMFAALAGQFARSRNRQFDSLEEALLFLKHGDPTLAEMDVSALLEAQP